MLKTDVTHERAALELLEQHPTAEAHAALALVKATREATAQLSLIETRLHAITEKMTPPRFVLVVDSWINPLSVVRVESIGDYDAPGATIYFADGKQVTYLQKTADELTAELASW